VNQKRLVLKLSIAEGDLVLVVTDNLPRGRWLLARVTLVVHSDDGRVRSAEIKFTFAQ